MIKTINILGDILITENERPLVLTPKVNRLFSNLHDVLLNSYFNIANIEAPLCYTDHKPIDKTGPNLKNPIELANLFSMANFKAVSLANNHIMDFGEAALENTIKLFKAHGIDTFGAGRNEGEAKKAWYVKVGAKTLGFVSFAEHEYNKAAKDKGGAIVFDPYQSPTLVTQAKAKCDFLTVLYHGGIEHYPYPSPLLQKVCRKIAEAGADFVTCQHSHCIGARENYLGTEILYGQGNSVFGYRKNHQAWNEGLISQLQVGENIKIKYIPIMAKKEGGIDLMKSPDADLCLSKLEKRNQAIAKAGFIENEWKRFCESQKSWYYPQFFGLNRFTNKMNRYLSNKLIDLLFSKRQKMISHNTIRCQSHREVMETIFEMDINNN